MASSKPAHSVVAVQGKKVAKGLFPVFGEPNFRWQMVFNAFSIEKMSNGTIVRVAYVVQNTAPEIVAVLVSNEGVQQLMDSAESYIQALGDVQPYNGPELPVARQFSPMFSNHVRVSHSGYSGEFAFYTVPLKELAMAARGELGEKAEVKCVQVALLHSEITLHKQLTMALLNSI